MTASSAHSAIEETSTERFVSGDPYALDPSAAKDPPVGWKASSMFFGPGLIVSASVVGAGALIAAMSGRPRRSPERILVTTTSAPRGAERRSST